MPIKLTAEQIEAARTANGGFDRATLASWGISWPPPLGWMQTLMAGEAFPQHGVDGEPATAIRPSDSPEAKLLHEVVMAVIEAGHGSLLASLKSLNTYYGHELPTVADVIGGRPEHAVITGGISFDDKVYSFTCARMTSQGASQ